MATVDNEFSYELSDQYLEADFPSKYRETCVKDMKDSEQFISKIIHDLFQSGKYKGTTMVEVGCGPTIHRLASASKYYDEIITSDYAPENIESVKKWLAGDPQALDWTPFLEMVAQFEGCSDLPSGVKNIEARIRGKVKSVVHCDVLKKSILPPEIKNVDLLLTAGCLEGACPTRESYDLAVKNLGGYVKQGGYIMMFVVLGMHSVDFHGKDIKVLSIDEDVVLNALKEAGFALDQKFFRENDIAHIKFHGTLLVTAKKL